MKAYLVKIYGAGKYSGQRIAYSIEQVPSRQKKRKLKIRVILKQGRGKRRIFCQDIKIIKEINLKEDHHYYA